MRRAIWQQRRYCTSSGNEKELHASPLSETQYVPPPLPPTRVVREREQPDEAPQRKPKELVRSPGRIKLMARENITSRNLDAEHVHLPQEQSPRTTWWSNNLYKLRGPEPESRQEDEQEKGGDHSQQRVESRNKRPKLPPKQYPGKRISCTGLAYPRKVRP